MIVMRRIGLILWVCLCCGKPDVHSSELLRSEEVERLREAYLRGDNEVIRYIDWQEKEAEKYVTMSPLSVTAKKNPPPSKDLRDYMTLSPYWWPDSTKTDGLPYIRRDGERNPEVYVYPERENAGRMSNSTYRLGMLYAITGKEVYAKACSVQLKTWFTDPKLGMNPNMVYAQFVPGMKTLRGAGLIDARHFILALWAAKWIEGSDSWTASDRRELENWVEAFCYWMENSMQGRMEARAVNNHGLWYEAIHLTMLAYLNRADRIREVVEQRLLPKIGEQLADDGSLPRELERTLSLHYSTFALEALVQVNRVTEAIGINVWSTPAPNGKTASQAIEYLYSYYLSPESWTFKQIKAFDRSRAAILLYEAGEALGNLKYVNTAKHIGLRRDNRDAETIPYLILKKK